MLVGWSVAQTYVATFRPGDLARIEENVAGSGPTKKAAKAKKPIANEVVRNGKGVEGVVYKVRIFK